jgi:hypothetical protein
LAFYYRFSLVEVESGSKLRRIEDGTLSSIGTDQHSFVCSESWAKLFHELF